MSDDENVIRMTSTNNTNEKGEQYPSTPRPEYVVEMFSEIKHVNDNDKNKKSKE